MRDANKIRDPPKGDISVAKGGGGGREGGGSAEGVAARERSGRVEPSFREIIPSRYLMINRYTFAQADA